MPSIDSRKVCVNLLIEVEWMSNTVVIIKKGENGVILQWADNVGENLKYHSDTSNLANISSRNEDGFLQG